MKLSKVLYLEKATDGTIKKSFYQKLLESLEKPSILRTTINYCKILTRQASLRLRKKA